MSALYASGGTVKPKPKRPKPPTSLPSRGYVRLWSADPPLDVVALLGEDPVKVTAGLGGWEVTDRPRQVGMTTWRGVEPVQLELPLMFDGWQQQHGQEHALRRLFNVARGDDESPPGRVRVLGIILPLPADTEWVIEGVDYGDVLIDPETMKRMRQALTLTLREYVPPEYLQLRKKARAGEKGKTKVVATKKGETPAKLARRVHCKWTDLRALNPKLVHKANHPNFKAGVKLRVPVASTHKRKPKSHRGTSSKHPGRS